MSSECAACDWFAAVIEQTSGDARVRVLRAWDRHMIEDAPGAAVIPVSPEWRGAAEPKEKSA